MRMRTRKTKVTLEEIIDDIIYFTLSAVLALIITFLFDIHHSFYQKNIFPLKFIFKSKTVYLIAGLAGGILGLVWIKIFIFALEGNTYKRLKKILTSK